MDENYASLMNASATENTIAKTQSRKEVRVKSGTTGGVKNTVSQSCKAGSQRVATQRTIYSKAKAGQGPLSIEEGFSVCSECKSSSVWNYKGKQLCAMVKNAYHDTKHYRPNLMNVPANKTGKSFLTKVADNLEWAASNGEEEHYAWYANSVLTAACLQSKDKNQTLSSELLCSKPDYS